MGILYIEIKILLCYNEMGYYHLKIRKDDKL